MRRILYSAFTMGDVQDQTHECSRVVGTVTVAIVHLLLGYLGFVGLLNYTVRTGDPALEQAASAGVWRWAHTLVGLTLLILLVLERPSWLSRGHSVSTMTLGVWSFFMLLWGLSAERPVTLAVPVLGLFAVVGTQILAHAWMREAERHDKGR